jgi:hypothetical protein
MAKSPNASTTPPSHSPSAAPSGTALSAPSDLLLIGVPRPSHKFFSARFSAPAPAPQFFVLLLLLLPLLLLFPLSLASFAQFQSPYISEIVGEDLASTGLREGDRLLFGSLEVRNPAQVSFILRVSFRGGGFFADRFWRPVIPVQGLSLFFRNRNNVLIERVFSAVNLGDANYVHEFQFLPGSEMQEVYRFELVGVLDFVEARRSPQGTYRETAYFEIEVLP